MQLRGQAKTCLSHQERNSPPFRKKRKENYSQVTDCMEKKEKKGSAKVSIYLFIKQGKTEGDIREQKQIYSNTTVSNLEQFR